MSKGADADATVSRKASLSCPLFVVIKPDGFAGAGAFEIPDEIATGVICSTIKQNVFKIPVMAEEFRVACNEVSDHPSARCCENVRLWCPERRK